MKTSNGKILFPQLTMENNPIPRSFVEPVCLALAGVLRERRERRGWSLSHLAARSRLSRQMVNYLESHARVPSADSVLRLGRALGVAASELFRQAERRAARWPARCARCNYCCVENGRLVWLNPARGCTRPGR
jgi:transcriptional regulator with XRE-family HTH domain